jgi:hypothetical protein
MQLSFINSLTSALVAAAVMGGPPTPDRGGLAVRQQAVLAATELAPGVKLEVLELKRVTGGLVHLAYAVQNDTDEDLDLRHLGLAGGAYASADFKMVSLLDLKNLKRHLAGNAIEGTAALAAHSRREYWTQHQAPPDDVTAMAVQVPHGALMYDIPISE